MNTDFSRRPVRWPIFLFGRKVMHVSAPMFVWERPFTDLPENPDALQLPSDDHAQGVFVRSQPVTADLPRVSRYGSLIRFVPRHYDRFTLTKRGTWEKYLEQFNPKTRKNQARQAKKFQELAGKDCFEIARTPEEIERFLDLATELVPRTYQARVFGNQLPTSKEFRERALGLARDGQTMGALLVHQGKAAAFWWFTINGDVLVSEYTGYDDDLKDHSPGMALLWLIVQRFFEMKELSVLDFGEGEAQYKRLYSTESRRCADLLYLQVRPRTLTLVGLESAAHGIKRVMQPLEDELEKRGIRAKLKRLVRSF